MSITAKGRPWDQDTYQRIERKGGCHFRSPVSDYVTLERMIESHDLRYGDRVEVYGAGEFNGIQLKDTVVVLNGGTYMSTGIHKVERVEFDPLKVGTFYREPSADLDSLETRIAHNELEQGDLVFIEGDKNGPLVASILPDRKYMILPTVVGVDPAVPGSERTVTWPANLHDHEFGIAPPIDYDAQRLATQYQQLAEYHRKRGNTWLVALIVCVSLMVGVLFIPTEWIYLLFEAFEGD